MPERKQGDLKERVAAEVRALMGRHNVTQTQLVEVLGVSQPQVGKRVRGEIAFDVTEIGLLADFFNVNPAELLGERGYPRPGPDGGSALPHGGPLKPNSGPSILMRSYRPLRAA